MSGRGRPLGRTSGHLYARTSSLLRCAGVRRRGRAAGVRRGTELPRAEGACRCRLHERAAAAGHRLGGRTRGRCPALCGRRGCCLQVVAGLRQRSARFPGRAGVAGQPQRRGGAGRVAPGAGAGLCAARLLLPQRRRRLCFRAPEGGGQHRLFLRARRAGEWSEPRPERTCAAAHLQLPHCRADGRLRAGCVRRQPPQSRVAAGAGADAALRARSHLRHARRECRRRSDPGSLATCAARGSPRDHRLQRAVRERPARQVPAGLRHGCRRGSSGGAAGPGAGPAATPREAVRTDA